MQLEVSHKQVEKDFFANFSEQLEVSLSDRDQMLDFLLAADWLSKSIETFNLKLEARVYLMLSNALS